MRYTDSSTDAFVQRDYTVKKYDSLEAVFNDNDVEKHFISYDYVMIKLKNGTICINMQRVNYVYFGKDRITLEFDDRALTITPDGLDGG